MSTTTNQDTQSLDSIEQILAQQVELGVNISPYLTAIQSLNGKIPGEKYKELNFIIKKILENNAQANTDFTCMDTSPQITPALIPLVRILVGNALKSNETVLEALKSEDKTIVNQALQAKWFFDSSNEIIQADYFINNVIPHISVRTRYRIIKILSKTLIGAYEKAQNFYEVFVDLYGLKEALPLLPACSEDFIFNEILTRKLILTHNMLLILYHTHPNLVIRYLNLGISRNEKNKEERKIHTIDLHQYKRFLPNLIRHNINDFIELGGPSICRYLGSTLTTLFFKNAADFVIKDPRLYLDLWSLKVICRKLTINQFEEMYGNLFPDFESQFNLSKMLRYLMYYPQEKRLSLLERLYKLKYSKDFISSIKHIAYGELSLIREIISVKIFEELFVKAFPSCINNNVIDGLIGVLHQYTRENKVKFLREKYKLVYDKDLLDNIEFIKNIKLLKLLPPDERKTQVMRIIETVEEHSDLYYYWYCYVPPKDSFPVFKEVIRKSSNEHTRCTYLKKMLESCQIDNNLDELLNFLTYYNIRHKNERIEILSSILNHIRNFDLKNLGKAHWQNLKEIIMRIYIKNELYKLDFYEIEPYFDGAVYHLMVQSKKDGDYIVQDMEEDNQTFLEKIFEMTIDYNTEIAEKSHYSQKWRFLQDWPIEQRYCLDKLVNLLPIKYPKDHTVWQSKKNWYKKLNLIINILNSFESFNLQAKELENNKKCLEKLSILNYPWLIETTKELFNSSHLNLKELEHILKRHTPEFYNSMRGNKEIEYRYKVNVRSGKAWIELKKNQDIVYTEWKAYLDECRERLQCNSKNGGLAAKRFLLTLKWYKDLPVKFIECCLAEMKVPGSLKVLAILLEGEVFGSLVTHFAPQESTVDIYSNNAKDFYKVIQSIPPAINFTNPPVSFDVIAMFCQGDYIKLAIQAFTNTSERVAKTKIMIFAENLIKKPVSVKKHGIKLIFKIATTDELREFVKKAWYHEKHISIRVLLAEMIKEQFVNKPDDNNWELMKICIDGLTAKDEAPLETVCNLTTVRNPYASQYIKCIINKIEELSNFEAKLKVKFVCAVINSIGRDIITFLSEDDILELLEKYYFDTDSSDISLRSQDFAKRVFSRPFIIQYNIIK